MSFAKPSIRRNKMKKYNPGDIAPQSGKYCVCDKNGKIMDKVDVEKGDHLPPTQSADYYYTCNCKNR